IGPDPRNFNQRVSLGRNDLLIRTFPNVGCSIQARVPKKSPFLPVGLLYVSFHVSIPHNRAIHI
ncbi:hypothetical protein ACRFDU_21440, partial [Klebsiella pneumoniae]